MGTNEQLSVGETSTWWKIKDFLSELIKTIMPRHTVVIILMIIIGYFLFYPTVRDVKTYEILIGLNIQSPFLYVYLIFGLIYLIGWMLLTWEINQMQEKTEKAKAEEETKRIMIGRWDRVWEGKMVKYLANILWIPENRIKREVSLGRMMADAVIYDANDRPIAVCESKNMWKFDKMIITRAIEQMKSYITGNPTLKWWYLFVSSDRWEDVSFYNPKWEKADAPPTYEELCAK